jgi:hypothetical protein
MLCAAGLFALGFFAFTRCPYFSSSPAKDQTAQMTLLEKRIDALETKVNSLTEVAAAVPSAPSAEDLSLQDTVKNLQAQMADIQSHSDQGQESARQSVSAAFAFWDLREATKSGGPFTAELAAFRQSESNPEMRAEADALTSYAGSPPPNLSELTQELHDLEPSLSNPVSHDEPLTVWQKTKTALGSFISIHPLHNRELADVEKALASGSAADAFDAYRFLPPEIQHQLAPWGEKLEARLTVDKTVATLRTSLMAPVASAPSAAGSTP